MTVRHGIDTLADSMSAPSCSTLPPGRHLGDNAAAFPTLSSARTE